MSYDQLTSKKLFVGGLPNDVTQEMLTKKFKTFGKVASVDIHKKKSLTDDTTNVFAFVSLNATLQNINKCIRTYNDSVWNGKTMKLQIARENFLDRLAAERKDNSIVKEWSLNSNNNNNNNNNNKKTSVTINDKTSNKVLKYVSSEDETDSDEESESGKKDAESSDDDDDDSSDEEQRGGARMKETNHKSGKPGVDSKADKASKKRKADDDDDDVGDDDDDDSDEEMSNKKIKLESQEDMLAEKKKNLEILTSVVGGKRSEKRKLPSTLSSQNSAMQRYDPSKPGHEEFEVEEEEEDGMECEPIAKKAKMEANEDDDDDDSSSDEEEHDDDNDVETKEKNDKQTTQSSATSDVKQFAEVSSTVVDAFKKSEEFKLSSLFGNDEDDEEDDDDDHPITQPPAKRPKLMTDMFGWDKEDVGDEESDDNDRSDDEGRIVKKKKKLKVEDADKKAGGKMKKTVAGKSGKFFFVANDPRLSEANTFYRTDDLEALRKKWEELRPQYVDSYKLRKRRYRMGKSKM